MTDSFFLSRLERARQGNPAARDELFTACRSYLALLARGQMERRLQGKVDASDLVQQTLMDAHRDFDRFAGCSEGEWRAWLKQMLRHNAGDEFRRFGGQRRAAHREVSFQQTASDDSARNWELPDSLGTPSQFVAAREEQLLLAKAMEELSEDHREVIFLRNMQKLPFDEVAAQMGRSRPAVQMLWMRALSRLKELLARESPWRDSHND